MNALRQLRKARTLRQEDVARLLGVTESAYCLYENGKRTPPVHIKARIAAILGCSVADLWPAAKDEATSLG